MEKQDISGYRSEHAGHSAAHAYLLPALCSLLEGLQVRQQRLFELGCGYGSIAHQLSLRSWDVTCVDPSREGIAQAYAAYPDLKLFPGSAYDDLAGQYGTFPVVDAHFTAFWNHGHIKFWSMKTLSRLLEEAELRVERFVRVGRVPALAKSMIAVARKP